MPVTYSPLRYPGGKSQLAPFVVELLRENDLFGATYAEPFAGGAGIAWDLLFNDYASEVWINDIDPAIHAFWNATLTKSEALCHLISKTDISIEEWHRQKEIYKTAPAESLELAFSTLFLNRTNRSGIIKAGVIGGLKQDGEWKLDCRFKKKDIIEKINRIALYSDQVKLTRLDAEKFLDLANKKLPFRSILNIDPPYYKKGPGLYCSFYEHADHVSLSEKIRSLSRPWMLTYDDATEIRALYKGLPSTTHALTYYAQVKRVGVELMVTSTQLSIPRSIRAA